MRNSDRVHKAHGRSPTETPVLAAAICVLGALLAAAPARGQDGGAGTWAVLGAGVSFAGAGPETNAGPGLAGHIGVRHQRGRWVFSARAGMNGGGSAPVTIFGGLMDRFDEVALLAGYALHRSERAQAVLSAGLAAVSGERVERDNGARNVPFETTAGVPVQVAISSPGAGHGPGLIAHVNLNDEEVFGAVTVTYQLSFGPGD